MVSRRGAAYAATTTTLHNSTIDYIHNLLHIVVLLWGGYRVRFAFSPNQKEKLATLSASADDKRRFVMEIIAKFFVRFFPKAAAEIRCLAVDEYEKKVAARESRRPRLSRANLLESLGFEEVPGDCDVQPPEGVCRYAFGHTWYLKGDTLVGLQPNESVVVKGVRKYPLDTQVGEEVTPNWEEDSSFYLPEDWVRGSMYWRGRDTPQFVVCTPPPDGRVRVTIEMQWGEDTPTASKFAVFKV